ncbi:hypothetical protein [Serratia fonticola]|uniref:hypothetical protein n=1 Tax=Serratia fonticola TaxID=47917 RepID=UPI00301D2E02
MVTIIVKPAKNSSRHRQFKATGEFFAMKDKIRADKKGDERLKKAVAIALIGSERVYRALSTIDGKASPRGKAVYRPSADNRCLPQVALFDAGHRQSKNPTESGEVTARV